MRRALLIAVLALPAASAAGGNQDFACVVEADPSPAWPGANVAMGGVGFPAGADITVSLGFFPVYDGFIADDGTFYIAFRVPSPFELGPTEMTVVDHTGECNTTVPITIGPAPEPEPSVAPWGLAVFALVGAALGVGVVGVLLRKR